MPVSLEIADRQSVLTPAGRERIEALARKLATFDGRLLSCRVAVDVPQRFPTGRPIEYRVGILLAVPGENLTIRRQRGATVLDAAQAAFAAATRRLQDGVRRRRGDVKRRAPRGASPPRPGGPGEDKKASH